MENSFVELKLRAATDQIRLAQDELDAAMKADGVGVQSFDAMKSASGRLSEARVSMNAIDRHLEADAQAEPRMRDCRVCGRSIRDEATLCGYCWKKQ